jgi:primary-amine oxidase
LKAAVESRGFTTDNLCVDPWCAGYYSPADAPDRRLCKPLIFIKEEDTDNIYGRPLLGIEMTVDIGKEQVRFS